MYGLPKLFNYLILMNETRMEAESIMGRFNQGVVTINLVDVALSSSGKDMDKFWKILEDTP